MQVIALPYILGLAKWLTYQIHTILQCGVWEGEVVSDDKVYKDCEVGLCYLLNTRSQQSVGTQDLTELRKNTGFTKEHRILEKS